MGLSGFFLSKLNLVSKGCSVSSFLCSGLVDRERKSFVRAIPMLSWMGRGHPTSFYLLLHGASW